MSLGRSILDVLGSSGPKTMGSLVRILSEWDNTLRSVDIVAKTLNMINAGVLYITTERTIAVAEKE